MSAARPLVAVLAAAVLCALGALATPALVADAAGAHARKGHPAARRAVACRHRPHRCRTAPHAAKRKRRIERPGAHRPTDASGAGGASNSSGAAVSVPATPGSGAAPGASGSSPSGEPASATTETPTTEAPEAPATPRVQVIAREYSFTLSRTEVPAGKVIVEFVNGGEDPHNLHLLEPVEGAEAGEFPTSSPGFHGDLTLNLRPGSYTLFCSLPGHEAKGMKATLTVH
jgi:plastocyanin